MSLASIIADLETQAKSAVAAVEGGIEKVAEQIGPVILTEIEDGLRALFGVALNAVMAELPKVASGTEKFGSAVTSVIQTVEAQGKAIAVADAQASVQTAFRAVQQAVAVPTAAGT